MRPLKDGDTNFALRTFFHNYNEYYLLNANAEAFELFREKELCDQLRRIRLPLCVSALPQDQVFIGTVKIPSFHHYKQLLKDTSDVLITWEPPPEPGPDGKAIHDAPHGWGGRILPGVNFDDVQSSVTIIFRRPTDPNNRYSDREMPAATKPGTGMPKQYIYLKVNLSTKTVKARLDGLKAHTFARPKDTATHLKRRLLCGKDLSVDSTVDLTKGVPDDEFAALTQDMTPSQRALFFEYVKELDNGFGLLQRPFGTGKTTVVDKLARMHKIKGQRSIVVTTQNAAADNAVLTLIAIGGLMVIRAHAIGAEVHTGVHDAQAEVDTLGLADIEYNTDDEDVTITADPSSIASAAADSSSIAISAPNSPPIAAADSLYIATADSLSTAIAAADSPSIAAADSPSIAAANSPSTAIAAADSLYIATADSPSIAAANSPSTAIAAADSLYIATADSPSDLQVAAGWFESAFPTGYDVIETSAQNLRCGCYAIIGTMEAMHPQIRSPTLQDFDAILYSQDYRNQVKEFTGQEARPDCFSPDELGLMLRHWSKSTGVKLGLGLYVDGPEAHKTSFYQVPYIAHPVL
ncbi:MAG: hypothetical protein LQ346_000330 [Caloplaca aetnensis]|nr:MAG: hypothetical protein LQ346_000330 [Caloplaca aetnensis]